MGNIISGVREDGEHQPIGATDQGELKVVTGLDEQQLLGLIAVRIDRIATLLELAISSGRDPG